MFVHKAILLKRNLATRLWFMHPSRDEKRYKTLSAQLIEEHAYDLSVTTF